MLSNIYVKIKYKFLSPIDVYYLTIVDTRFFH